MQVRAVPENRIKQLSAVITFDSLQEESHLRQRMIVEVGTAIAEKLFEFNKVLVTKNDNTFTMIAKIEIIVPEGPPNALPR